jgi:hypothetical protein
VPSLLRGTLASGGVSLLLRGTTATGAGRTVSRGPTCAVVCRSPMWPLSRRWRKD